MIAALSCMGLITPSLAVAPNEITVKGKRTTCGEYGRPCEPIGGSVTKDPGKGPVGAAGGGGGTGGVIPPQWEKDREKKNCARLSDRVEALKADVAMFQADVNKLDARMKEISNSPAMRETDVLEPLRIPGSKPQPRPTSPADDANKRLASLRYQQHHAVQNLSDSKVRLRKTRETQRGEGCSP